jgi:hypothetical protein
MLLVFAACGRSGFVPGGLCDGAIGDGASADPSLLIHLTFDDSTDIGADSSGFHHDGACQSCPFQAAGLIGTGAASFSSNNCLVIADALALRATAFTAALWMNASSFGSGMESLFARPFNGATTNSDTFEVDFQSDISVLSVGVSNLGEGVNVAPNWHHVALAFDGGQLTEFVDGSEAHTSAVGAATYGPDQLYVGCDFDFGAEDRYYGGLMDDLRFYNRLLSADEIAALAAM